MNLPIPFALLLIACGLALLMWGRYLFYAWLPFFYGLLGFEIGFLLGTRLFGYGSAPIIVGVVLGIVVASATYFLEPYRRIVIGYLGGSVAALALLGLDRSTGGFVVAVVAICGGVAGALLAAKYLDYLVIATTAFGGAALSALGTQALLSLLGASGGSSIAFPITVALTAVGVVYQMRHLESWTPDPLPTHAAPEQARPEDEARGRAR